MKDLRLENLNTWQKILKVIGLLSTATSVGYASLKLGSPDFELWVGATLVLTGVFAVFASNVLSARMMKLDSNRNRSSF